MKNTVKLLLVAAFTLGSTALFAQKFGRIDYAGVIQAMPEMADVQTKLQAAQAEYEDHLEGLQVELNNKVNDLQNAPETMSESLRQLRNREIQELNERLQQYYQIAQEELQKTQMDLMTPLQEKTDAAIAKVSKADGIVVVFQNDSVVYLDPAAVVDVTAKVRTELGITATPAPAPAQ
ncbi:MAG: OmpH family outer membrane protein [Alistipes sp.]|jgi:outer membrane protein|nr:OmpH family outer membrane protein [Alistipes sp.]